MRQSNLVAATVLAAALAAAATASAQARPDAQTKPSSPTAAPGLSSKPYSQLFERQRSEASEALRATVRSNFKLPDSARFKRPDSARRFICGTPVLPADSAIDPRFERPLRPFDATTRFSMRVVTPTACH
jgi:hypothetical protein